MSEELVAWVDENEKFIKAIPISLANSDPKYLHVEIAGLVFDDQKRILLQQRAKTKKVAPSLWTVTVAGHVTYGDTIEATFHKELKEEMGIAVKEFKYLFCEKISKLNETHFCHWYLGKYNGGKIIIEPSEVDSFRWISESELLNFVTNNQVGKNTIKMCNRFWTGEWDSIFN